MCLESKSSVVKMLSAICKIMWHVVYKCPFTIHRFRRNINFFLHFYNYFVVPRSSGNCNILKIFNFFCVLEKNFAKTSFNKGDRMNDLNKHGVVFPEQLRHERGVKSFCLLKFQKSDSPKCIAVHHRIRDGRCDFFLKL